MAFLFLLVPFCTVALTEVDRAFGRRQGAHTPIVDEQKEVVTPTKGGSHFQTTIVTAYFLMESKYPSDKYVEWMKHFFKLETPMVSSMSYEYCGPWSLTILIERHCFLFPFIFTQIIYTNAAEKIRMAYNGTSTKRPIVYKEMKLEEMRFYKGKQRSI
jgi:hypothetical protein